MRIVLEQEKPRCTSITKSFVSMRKINNTILLQGQIILPNPCYRLEMMHKTFENEIAIRLHTQRLPGFCIQCIASINFKIRISDLPHGEFTITVLYQGETLNSFKITM